MLRSTGIEPILDLLLTPRPGPGNRYATADALTAKLARVKAEKELCHLLLALEAYRIHRVEGIEQSAIAHRIRKSPAWVCRAIRQIDDGGRAYIARALTEHGKRLQADAANTALSPLERAKAKARSKVFAQAAERILAGLPAATPARTAARPGRRPGRRSVA